MKKSISYVVIIALVLPHGLLSMDKNPPLCTLSAFYIWACERPGRENKAYLIKQITQLNKSEKVSITPIDRNSSKEDIIVSAKELLKFCHKSNASCINGIVIEQVHSLAHAIAKK